MNGTSSPCKITTYSYTEQNFLELTKNKSKNRKQTKQRTLTQEGVSGQPPRAPSTDRHPIVSRWVTIPHSCKQGAHRSLEFWTEFEKVGWCTISDEVLTELLVSVTKKLHCQIKPMETLGMRKKCLPSICWLIESAVGLHRADTFWDTWGFPLPYLEIPNRCDPGAC